MSPGVDSVAAGPLQGVEMLRRVTVWVVFAGSRREGQDPAHGVVFRPVPLPADEVLTCYAAAQRRCWPLAGVLYISTSAASASTVPAMPDAVRGHVLPPRR